MKACDDCATCTRRPALARDLGRTTHEVQRLSERCPGCDHRLHRHLHGLARTNPTLLSSGIELAVGPPPRESPLGRLLIELGEYDDYLNRLDR